jgi:putative ABC transport system ATP-binding protein
VINSPLLLLADEPTSALDDQNCAIVHQLLSEQARAHNAALVIVTHDARLKTGDMPTVDLQKTS